MPGPGKTCDPISTRYPRRVSSRLLSSFGALRERPFRLLFFGRSLSAIGDAIVPVATTFAVLELGDASDLGLVLGSYFGSRIVFVVVGGVWADRLPRQLVMIAADVLRASSRSTSAACATGG